MLDPRAYGPVPDTPPAWHKDTSGAGEGKKGRELSVRDER